MNSNDIPARSGRCGHHNVVSFGDVQCVREAGHSGQHWLAPVDSPEPSPAAAETPQTEREKAREWIKNHPQYAGSSAIKNRCSWQDVDGLLAAYATDCIREEREKYLSAAPAPGKAPIPEHCEVGARIIAKHGTTVVLANGECTELYWHLQNCDACAHLREVAAAYPKPEGARAYPSCHELLKDGAIDKWLDSKRATSGPRTENQPPAWKDCGQGGHEPGSGCGDCRDAAADQPEGGEGPAANAIKLGEMAERFACANCQDKVGCFINRQCHIDAQIAGMNSDENYQLEAAKIVKEFEAASSLPSAAPAGYADQRPTIDMISPKHLTPDARASEPPLAPHPKRKGPA